MKLEVVVIPVSDVDRAKSFYTGLGWRLDADVSGREGFRVVHVTPRGSPCSVIFGSIVTAASPGSAQGLHLVVTGQQLDLPSAGHQYARSTTERSRKRLSGLPHLVAYAYTAERTTALWGPM
jgi:catechol 2,3-dioxygenase-like lactoylglutathione lyase family enzyme